MKEGLHMDAPVSPETNRAIAYAIYAVSSASSLWLILHAVAALRWW